MRWSAYLVAGLLMVGAFSLLLDPELRPRDTASAPDEAYFSQVSREWRVAAAQVRDLSLVDSLTALLRTRAPDGGFVLEAPGGVVVADGERIRGNGLALLEDAGGSSFRLGLFVVDPETHAPAGARPGGVRLRYGRTFAGLHDGVPYCFRVLPRAQGTSPSREMVLGLPRGRETEWVREFGLCTWVARYGLPGEGLSRWLRRYGGVVAREWNPVEATPEELELLRRSRGNGVLRAPGDGCRLGRPEACAAAFQVVAAPVPGSQGTWQEPADGPWRLAATDAWVDPPLPNGFFDGSLLAELERDFGADAFRAFWSSELPVATAFEASFGQDAGAWYARRAVSRWDGLVVQARWDRSLVLTTLLLLSGSAWWATAAARRRRIP